MLSAEAIILRLGLAALCGGVIGYQRERKDRPAGFRTHILVSLGSALFMIVSISRFDGPSDPTRIAAQVVTGIGFLGAGTIIRQGNIVIGLTTAASLWSVSAVGLAAGAGNFVAAALGASMIFLVLSIFKILETRISGGKKLDYLLTVVMSAPLVKMTELKKAIVAAGAEVVGFELERKSGGNIHLAFEIRATSPAFDTEEIGKLLISIEGVSRVKWEEAVEATALFGIE